MSWWIYLDGAGPVTRHEEGGTIVVGGTQHAELNVTYNYSEHLSEVGCHPRDDLNGKRAGDTLEQLQRGVEKLGTTRAANYWKGTRGNAGHALSVLLAWAREYPNAKWDVS